MAYPRRGSSTCRECSRSSGRNTAYGSTHRAGKAQYAVALLRAASAADPKYVQAKLDRIPLRRFCTAEEVAAAVSYLASPQADYITGHTLMLDGGLSALADKPDLKSARSEHHLTAVHLYGLTRESWRRAGEKHHARDFLRFAIACERYAFRLGTRGTARGARGVHRSGCDAVGAHTLLTVSARERAGRPRGRVLRPSRSRGAWRQPATACRPTYNRAAAVLEHRRQACLGAEKRAVERDCERKTPFFIA